MSHPIRIRSKNGTVIDLRQERELAEWLARETPNSPSAQAELAIVEALIAVLSIEREKSGSMVAWNQCLQEVHEAAGAVAGGCL
jgi:hypothetical protein